MTLRLAIQSRIPGLSTGAGVRPEQRPAFLEIIGIPAFRHLWASNGLTSIGMNIRPMAIAWLILEMTDSQLWMGVANGLPTMAIVILSLLGGVLADRMDRRVILLWARTTMAILSFLAAFLITMGLIELWQILALVVLVGGVDALSGSVSRTFVTDIVGKERLFGALATNQVGINLGMIVGPSVAGILIANIGVDAALFMAAGGYLIAAGFLLFVKGESEPSASKGSSILRDLVEGFAYIRSTSHVRWLLSLASLIPIAAVFLAMIPIYARDVLDVGSEGLGFLVGAFGVGSLVGSMILTLRGNVGRKGLVLGLSLTTFSIGMLVFAFSGTFSISLACIFFMGIAAACWINTMNTVVQTSVKDEVRGRVMGVFGMVTQLTSLGWLIGGVLATLVGPQYTLVISGVIVLAFNGLAFVRSRELRQIE